MPVTPSSSRSSSPSPERSDAASAAAPAKRGSMEGNRDVSPKKESPETAKVTEATKTAIGREAITFERKRGSAPQMSEAEREANRALRAKAEEKRNFPSTEKNLGELRTKNLQTDVRPGVRVNIKQKPGAKNQFVEQEINKVKNDYKSFTERTKQEMGAVKEEDETVSDEEETKIESTPAQAAAAPAKPKEALSAPISFGGNRRGGSQMTKAQSDTNKEMREKVAAARLARGENPSNVRKPTNTSNLKPISEEDE